jgi:hypothetical protein
VLATVRVVVAMTMLVATAAATAAAAGRNLPAAQAPRFADYPAGAAYRGTPAAPDFRRNPAAEPFAMHLTEAVRRGPNFAGYLRVVEWSCGTSCQRWMLVNTRNGRIHDSPEPAFSLEYQLNSLLLVVNTVGRFTAADPPSGVPIVKYYVWRNERLTLIDTRALRATRSGSR